MSLFTQIVIGKCQKCGMDVSLNSLRDHTCKQEQHLPFDCLKEFRDSYDYYPSQDSEGWMPDRGSYKAGFFACYHKLNAILAERDADRAELLGKLEKLRKEINGIISGGKDPYKHKQLAILDEITAGLRSKS